MADMGDILRHEPDPTPGPTYHEMPCPHCGKKTLHDDKAGGLHCHSCGLSTQMGWDDPESWMEGKFDWDFNLPLEGMAELEEEGNPEASWVIPTRDYGPRRVGSPRHFSQPPEGGVYHEAPTSERARIMTHGLHPAHPRLNIEQWGPSLAEGMLRDQPEGIYTWAEPPTEPSPNYDVWHIPADQIHEFDSDPLTSGMVVKHPVFPTLYHRGPEDTSMAIWKDKGQKWKELNENGMNPSYAPMVYDKEPEVTNPSKMISFGSSRSLYHGTLLDHLPSIQQHGLIPDVGPFVSDAYQEESGMSPDEYGVRPTVFMTDKKRLQKAVNAMIHNVGQKLNKKFHEVTPLDLRNHGLLLKHKGEMGYEDPPMPYVFDEEHEEPFESQYPHEPPERPYQAEPGDFYSEEPIGSLEYLHGPAMMRVLERHNAVPPSGQPFAWNVVENAMQQHRAWNFKTASINARKHYTTAEDHERGKRRWGLPHPHYYPRQAAVDPEWLKRWIEVNGPYMVHQTEDDKTREKIMQEGLIPHDQGVGSQYSGSLTPRSNHTYLSRNLHSLNPDSVRPMMMQDPGTRNERGENATQRRSVAIDLRKLDPSRINGDEDAFDAAADHRSRVPASFELEYPSDLPVPSEKIRNVPEDFGSFKRKQVGDPEGGWHNSWGEWADANNVTAPHHTAWSMNTIGNAAIQGGVNPEALVRPHEAWADLQQNYPHAIPPSYGKFHTPVPMRAPRSQQLWTMPEQQPSVETPAQGQLVARTSSPVSEPFWELFNQPLYHGTSPDRLESIMQHGIVPWDTELAGGTNYPEGWLEPRPGHVYLSQDPYKAHYRGLSAEIAKYPEGTNVEDEVYNPKTITFRINPSYLNPHHINPDEDYMPGASFDERDKDMVDKYKSLGNMAEQFGWGDIPSETEGIIHRGKHIAYKGTIPPEALTPGRVRNETWEPLVPQHSAALIGDMRDGFGRFAASAPWEFGKYGKGLFFPETGRLVLWSDERGHVDVWADDEFGATPGPAHHLIIKPDGMVRDQGSFNRNFEDEEPATVELAQALQEYDPRLKLDKSEDWEFGPTEPMEEEPSSISRGEEGGKDSPTLQTSNDFAGSL